MFFVYGLSFIVSASRDCWLKNEGLSFIVYGLSCQYRRFLLKKEGLSFIVFRLSCGVPGFLAEERKFIVNRL